MGCSKGEEADAVDVCASEFVDEADEVHRATHKDELPRDKLRRQRRARVFFERGMDSWKKKKVPPQPPPSAGTVFYFKILKLKTMCEGRR